MTTPEKRWQLLLVADDGRIVPFKHIKGIALTLILLLVLMGVLCAGLGWQLAREKIGHDQTREQLASARQEMGRYKSENEIVTAELILAEARMEKAGLAVPQRPAHQSPEKSPPPADQAQAILPPEPPPAMHKEKPSPLDSTDSAKSEAPPVAEPGPSLEKAPVSVASPAVALGDMQLDHNSFTGRLAATFRVSNTGPRSTPAEGWCLVALKDDPADATTWVGLPDGALKDGKLDPRKGKKFKVSSFVDVDMQGPSVDKPAPFTTATVYIFDSAGAVVLEKDYSISLKSVRPGADASFGGGAEESGVLLDRFGIQQDAQKRSLRATFRVSNAGPRSAPVAGRCVVVLKNEQTAPDTWMALPAGAVVDGQPRKEQGQPFKISRFKDMQIEAAATVDPSVYNRAVVYIFDMDGAVLLEKTFPVSLTAFAP